MLDNAIVGFDPLKCFIEVLQKRFGHLADFFVDGAAGDWIGVVFHSRVKSGEAPFGVATCAFTIPVPVANGRMVETRYDPSCILSEMRIMGGALVVDANLHPELEQTSEFSI